MEQTSDGGFVACGWTQSFGQGDRDAYVVKTDAEGGLLWEAHFGAGDDWVRSVIETADGGFAAAGVSSRGNADADSGINLTDAVFILNYLFRSGDEPSCLEAADTNGDKVLNLTDGVYLLNFLFAGGARPPEPFETCGVPPASGDVLGCRSHASCT